MEFNLAYIPDDYVSQAAEPFDKKEMNRLFDIGFELGRSGKAWTKRPPGVVAEPTASQPARGDRL
jgi:hypothetical protein